MQAAKSAYRIGFGAEPVFLRSGGTIPAVSLFQEKLGIATLLMGFALPDDGMHAPNEKFYIPNFFNGITTCICFLAALAEQADSYADINLQARYYNDLSPNAKERSR